MVDPDLPNYVIRGKSSIPELSLVEDRTSLSSLFRFLLCSSTGSEAEKSWRRSHPNGYKIMSTNTAATGSTDIHSAATKNDPERLERLLKKQSGNVNKRDVNGWMPLHVS